MTSSQGFRLYASLGLPEVHIDDRDEAKNGKYKYQDAVVVPMDAVKPLDKRRGWTAAQVGEYTRERFEDLVSAGWDSALPRSMPLTCKVTAGWSRSDTASMGKGL